MRKIFIFVFLLLIFPFFASQEVFAVTCESVSISQQSGDINTEFVFTATGCRDEPEDFAPDLRIEYENVETGFWSSITPIRQAGDPYTLTANIGGFIYTGSYNIGLIQYRGQDINDATLIGFTSFTVNPAEGEPPPPPPGGGGTPTISCGSICSEDNTCSLCPAWCPAANVTRPDGAIETRCTVDAPMLCGGANGAGIDSAIGCIPFEDTNLTAQFFLRWALGVGGGISLFLISISAVRIMTVKDDTKRLQDARDMLSAAIAGLVLIILSVFLVRFFAETLLSLF